jgi:hypothetical protein
MGPAWGMPPTKGERVDLTDLLYVVIILCIASTVAWAVESSPLMVAPKRGFQAIATLVALVHLGYHFGVF